MLYFLTLVLRASIQFCQKQDGNFLYYEFPPLLSTRFTNEACGLYDLTLRHWIRIFKRDTKHQMTIYFHMCISKLFVMYKLDDNNKKTTSVILEYVVYVCTWNDNVLTVHTSSITYLIIYVLKMRISINISLTLNVIFIFHYHWSL